MKKRAIVFVHGVNEHDPITIEDRTWRAALKKGGIDLHLLGIPTVFGYYSDWFFEGSNRAAESDFETEIKKAIDQIESLQARDGNSLDEISSKEILGGFDPTTLVPEPVIRAFLKPLFEQLFQYFNNSPITHPVTNATKNARTVIRKTFVDAVKEARALVGDDGEIIVLAHSMGSVVAWDCMQHVNSCPKVNGFITFGSPLALDFVHRGLSDANGNRYRQTFPKKLEGDWHNIASHLDIAAISDTDFVAEFGHGDGHKIHTHRMVNPKLLSIGGMLRLVTSAHDLEGYLQHRDMSGSLDALGVEDEVTRSERRTRFHSSGFEAHREAVTASAAKRFNETEARRKQVASQIKTGGLIAAESKERIIQKLSLMDYPKSFAIDLVNKWESGTSDGVTLERVLGEVDFLPSAFALKAAALTSAVGKVVVQTSGGLGWSGTGFLISDSLMMTNNHVLMSPEIASNAELWLDYSLTSEDEEKKAKKVALRPDRFFITSPENELDYTIVALDVPAETLRRPWVQLISKSGKALVGDHINIIQHPDGRRQEVVFRSNKVTFVNEHSAHAYYTADTEGGSSGSPVFNDHWQLAFLHHASVPQKNSSGQVLKKDGRVYRRGDPDSDINWIANEGIRISRIVSDAKTKLLSSHHHAMFERAFDDPDLTKYVHIAPDTFGSSHPSGGGDGAASEQSSGPPTGGPRPAMGPDGSASWLFELNFGPAGQRSQLINYPNATVPPEDKATDALPKPSVAPSSVQPIDQDIRKMVGFLIERAQLEDEYYDEEKDAVSIEAYYDDMAFADKQDAYQKINKLIRKTHTKEYSYTRARHDVLYPNADRHPEGELRSIYSNEILVPEDVMSSELNAMLSKINLPLGREVSGRVDWIDYVLDYGDQLDLLEAQTTYNCEHVVPQSWFDKRQPMKADIHHLFTCEWGCNSFRSNHPYAEFEDYEGGHLDPEEAKLRKLCGYVEDLEDDRFFEPQNGKGVVARATLYFLLRYPGEVGDSKGEYSHDDVETLIDWHRQQEITSYEKHRNRVIFLTQGNRNPLIDHPDWVDKIDWNLAF